MGFTRFVLGAALAVAAAPALGAPDCAKAQRDLGAYLDARPRDCTGDADCEALYLRADACAPPVVLAKVYKADDDQALAKLQGAVGQACGAAWSKRPACAPIPAVPKCVAHRCVDRLNQP